MTFSLWTAVIWSVTVNMLNTFMGQSYEMKENMDALNLFSETPIEFLLPLEREALLLAPFPSNKSLCLLERNIGLGKQCKSLVNCDGLSGL